MRVFPVDHWQAAQQQAHAEAARAKADAEAIAAVGEARATARVERLEEQLRGKARVGSEAEVRGDCGSPLLGFLRWTNEKQVRCLLC